METYLNFHAHRPAASPAETVIRNHILPAEARDIPEGTGGDYFSAGIHPWHIPPRPEETLEELSRWVARPGCKAIGEAGMDKYASAPLPLQRELFMRQAGLAAAHRLPLIVHCVKAWGDLMAARKDIPAAVACIVHGFRGKPQLAASLLAKGFYLSFGFRFHPESLALCPPDRLFFETDEDPRSVEMLYHIAARLRACPAEDLRLQCLENLDRISPSPKN